jgi:hypothetical protein
MKEVYWIETNISRWKKIHLRSNNIIEETYCNVVDYMGHLLLCAVYRCPWAWFSIHLLWEHISYVSSSTSLSTDIYVPIESILSRLKCRFSVFPRR